MDNLTDIGRYYSGIVDNGRTNDDIVEAAEDEIRELKEEVHTDSAGEDGILGESIDVIACMLDMIFKNYPNVTNKELNELLIRKCEKWAANYANSPHKPGSLPQP